jgi:hypothetical protein
MSFQEYLPNLGLIKIVFGLFCYLVVKFLAFLYSLIGSLNGKLKQAECHLKVLLFKSIHLGIEYFSYVLHF